MYIDTVSHCITVLPVSQVRALANGGACEYNILIITIRELMHMTENVSRFFERCDADPALRARIDEAVACYPGSLEIRESLVEAVLLPIAAELGLPFTVDELRAYETRKKLSRLKPDTPIAEGDEDEDADFAGYWLLDRGWENDVSIFQK